MMKHVWLLLLLCSTLPVVLAAEHVATITLPVALKYAGERDYTLLLPQGFERHQVWSENQTHSDETFDYTYYWVYNESTQCPDSTTAMGNFSNSLSNMSSLCSEAFIQWNKTLDYRAMTQAAEDHYADCNASLTVEMERRITMEKVAAQYQGLYDTMNQTCNADLTTCKTDLTTCQGTLGNLQNNQAGTTTCQSYVDTATSDLKSGRNNFLVLGFIAGIAGTFGFMKWKQPKGRDKLAGGQTHGDGF